MKSRFVLGILIVVALVATPTTQAPYRAEFTASTTHNLIEFGVPVVSSYELRVFAPGSTSGSAPVATVNVGKPTPNASNLISVDVTSTLLPLPASLQCPANPTLANCYSATVASIGPAGRTESAASPPFPLVPSAPGPSGIPSVRRQ